MFAWGAEGTMAAGDDLKDSTAGDFCLIGVCLCLTGGFRLLLVAVGTAQQEAVAFLEEESMAMNRMKIHLKHK